MDQTGAPQRADLGLGQAELLGGGRHELGDGLRVAERVRGLEVDEVRDRAQRGVEAITGQHDRERRLGADHRVPGRDRIQPGQDLVGVAIHDLGERGVELLAGALAGELPRRVHAADAMCDLDVLGQHRHPRCQRHLLSAELARPAASVPHLVRAAQRVEHVDRQLELLAQRPRDRGVVGDHVVDLAMP